MKRIITVLAAFLALTGIGHAATVTNKGSDTVVLVVVENGSRMDVAVDAGMSESLCSSGCFVTLPNGDRIALDGGATVKIIDGSAVIK